MSEKKHHGKLEEHPLYARAQKVFDKHYKRIGMEDDEKEAAMIILIQRIGESEDEEVIE